MNYSRKISAHLAALAAGKTLALDVQNEYVLFVQAQTVVQPESAVGDAAKKQYIIDPNGEHDE